MHVAVPEAGGYEFAGTVEDLGTCRNLYGCARTNDADTLVVGHDYATRNRTRIWRDLDCGSHKNKIGDV